MEPKLPATFVKGFHDEAGINRMKYNPFGKTDLVVSEISLGTATLSKLFGNLGETDGVKAVHLALKSGINYIDTAPYYGQGRSEEILGVALKDIPRQTYYIATKVGRYEFDYKHMFDYSAKKTCESVEKSLKLLGVKRLDVVQIHDIEFASNLNVIINETLPALEQLRAEEHNLAVICAAGHSMGLFTNSGPPAWHPAQEQTKTVRREASNYCRENGVELGKLAMYHFIQMKGPATFLCGMQTESLVAMNLDAFFNGLNDKERSVLEYLNKKYSI
ncbi:uncharacterized protein LOC129732338 [Wyeomyia smithii]|uniref:uncharacterized protein LOC129732338 n=1 Tax=Wyeomyia smithii TaxID=174621 RepID=UPI00246808B9|nr:uncharacterized protein LOC129732338 [Wyeomyia smithii]